MDKLIFLHNELMSLEVQKEMKLPLRFITFAIAEGKMYKHYHNPSNFIVDLNETKRWGNEVIYGALFLCKDFEFYSTILDAYHVCSMSTMSVNHTNDLHHRKEVEVRPISFASLEDLSRLKYTERTPVTAQIYKGNTKHPKISSRINANNPYRIVDGIDAEHFKELYWEVKDEQANYDRLCRGL